MALFGIAVWVLAAGIALSAPIESFTGWLLNSFQGYYRVGDRVVVGDVRGVASCRLNSRPDG